MTVGALKRCGVRLTRTPFGLWRKAAAFIAAPFPKRAARIATCGAPAGTAAKRADVLPRGCATMRYSKPLAL